MGTQTQLAKEKLTGTKVQNYDFQRVAIVDADENPPLYAEIEDDELVIPGGWIVILTDGADSVIKFGNGKVWSEAIALSAPAAP